MRIRLACSPDADDLFMMRALLEGLIDTRGHTFDVETVETDALNRMAGPDGPHVSAMSIAWYPRLADRYQLLPHGGSMGEGYGPVVIAARPISVADLAGKRVAVPGLTTTAYAVLRMMAPIEPVVTPITPYSRIFDALRAGDVDAGLVIHEGRLTYADEGFVRVAELGEWWAAATGGLPLPLGGNAIRRDLGPDVIGDVSAVLRDSIRHGLDHRDEAITWLLTRGGALGTRERVDEYLRMYANERTFDYGAEGRAAIVELLRRIGFVEPVDFAP